MPLALSRRDEPTITSFRVPETPHDTDVVLDLIVFHCVPGGSRSGLLSGMLNSEGPQPDRFSPVTSRPGLQDDGA